MQRFKEKQLQYFNQAYQEIKAGIKLTHWMWIIFPQIKGLGYSIYSQYYGIKSLNEAKEYLNDYYLRNNLITITKALLVHAGKKHINEIFDPLDSQKLLSCMTLFNLADNEYICGGIFQDVINKFFNGKKDEKTLQILGKMKPFNIYNSSNSYYYNNNNYYYGNFEDLDSLGINYKGYPENKHNRININHDYNSTSTDNLKKDKNKNENSIYSELQHIDSSNSHIYKIEDNTGNIEYNWNLYNQNNYKNYLENNDFSNINDIKYIYGNQQIQYTKDPLIKTENTPFISTEKVEGSSNIY